MTHSSQTPKNTMEAQAAFERLRPEYARLTRKLETLLVDLLMARGLSYHLIESRTKDLKSFSEKAARSSKTYADPLQEMTDLSGIRVIAYYDDEAKAIGELISQEFTIDEANSLTQSAAPAEFGYRSAHYVVSLNDPRAALLEWAGLAGLKAEIQVRTVLQHAWAAISHKLQYKREGDVPAPLRRKLFRLSALFELADDEFISLRDASGMLARDIETRINAGNLELPLDSESLRRFLATSPDVDRLASEAKSVGFRFDDLFDEIDDDSSTISDIIQLASIAGISTVAGFSELLTASLPWANEYLNMQYTRGPDSENSPWHVTPAFICELILIRSKNSQLRASLLPRLGWEESIAARVFEVARQFAPSGA